MSNLPPLGDSGMDLPYEANPEATHIDEQMILSGGVVVAAATLSVDGVLYPALMFRFALPHGEFLPPVTLVCSPAQMEALIPLVTDSVAGAIKASDAG